ncbi:MAG: dihydroorotate dehydrogenase [candidate division KSB1 bacterium]|nr:dihydroorotate dehydrogenase [candidate division KSB1 bacterium]MDZ7275793.1 dihydroorotate dehydrogenase [candidate division KSB1 bacterium]MDZ7287545.1 dihydroorotate dehydrogenase [candidate division KSB1 bacterium]MDZ7307971.1 dihydroorotate dehydrogenase [candidate division KSB1 bacterium]MDZ7350523.1 dihydroorotate dehydrogenase [candidate division KSB1 bacterium]
MNPLQIHIGRVEFATPVFVASGTFGYGQEAAELVDLRTIGAIVTKSIGATPRAGNPPPRLCETPAGLLNSIGLQNVGVHSFVTEKLPFLRAHAGVIIVNVAGRTLEEYQEVVTVLEEQEGIAGYELNFSCPNVKEGGLEFSQKPAVTAAATAAIRRLTQRLVIPKLTPNVTRVSEIAQAAEAAGADAVSLINTVTGMAVDIETWRPRLNTVVGGYSGPAIKPIALAKVYEAANAVRIPVIGMGGIRTWQDAVEFFLVGATAVQIGTANFVDPRSAVQVAEGLRAYLAAKGLGSIAALRGRLQR